MPNTPLILQVPTGVKDWLPGEARRKRELENSLADLFQRWGYQEVVTPTFEYYETLTADGGGEAGRKLHKFIDPQGRILALRPDMTTPIARLVATRLRERPAPLRLFYAANVFRFEATQAGRQREFYQAGVELLGAAGPWADAEVIALAVEALRTAGLSDFQVGIGQVEITRYLLEQLELPEEAALEIKEALSRKDLVGLEVILEESGVSSADRQRVTTLCSLHGDRQALGQARQLVRDERLRTALDNLAEVWEALEAYGVTDRVFFDLGILRDFDYYTGIVFEGYATGIGFPVCGGGRYDRLLSRFNYSCPATGFALGLERVLLANRDGGQRVEEVAADYLVTGGDHALVCQKAAELRQEGWVVEVDVARRSLAEARSYVAERGIANLLVVGENKG
ncbi:hypothetical protein SY88_13640 [Clostridiales bacterium PH28_bin88]|nr:hypothetical protein SY88_13640 [Clostridiales bacterium PH28_bin88]